LGCTNMVPLSAALRMAHIGDLQGHTSASTRYLLQGARRVGHQKHRREEASKRASERAGEGWPHAS
jgi:hypothetical protein